MTEISGTHLWSQEIHGVGGHNPLFGPAGAALYFSDGWGNRPVPALRFRRLDIETGAETARWPCGSPVRCLVALDGGDLLVATDQRLAQLDPLTLAERARWNRSVRHATTMAVHRGVVVAGNPVASTITLVDLDDGAVRRKRHGPVLAILGRADADPVLVGGSAGGMATIDPTSGTVRRLRPSAPAMAAAIDPDQRGIWLIAGVRVHVTHHARGASMRPGEAVTRMGWHPIGDGPTRDLDVPLPVRTIAVGPRAVWLTPGVVAGPPQYVMIGDGEVDWQLWRAPERESIEAVAPALDLALTTTRKPGAERTLLSCYRLGA
jgi:hypothetical protein